MTVIRNRTRAERQNTRTTSGWTAEKQLYTKGDIHRRILFLELVVHGIRRLESCETLADFQTFEAELKDTRAESWGRRPWPRVNDAAGFEEHVLDLAREFVAATAANEYSSRSYAP